MLAALLLAAAPAPPLQKVCGWLHNPTPGNYWLTDRAGQWVLSSQGGAQAPGWEELAMDEPKEWVKTNGYYGYGCACATMRVDRRKGEVVEITAIRNLPLKTCRSDAKLPKP